MSTPIIARQLGSTHRIWLGAFVFIVAVGTTLASTTPKAHAEGLLPELATIDLPLGDTILEPVLTPVTDVTNDLLPVDINPGSDSIAATVAPESSVPILGKAEQPLLAVAVPVQPVARSILQPTQARRQAPSPQPSPQSVQAKEVAATDKPTVVLASATRIVSDMRPLRVVGMVPVTGSNTENNDLIGLLPASWQTSVRTFMSKPDFAPSIISVAILLAVIAMIVNILYVSRRNGLVWSGNSRAARLSQRVDLTQLSVLLVSITGTVAVIIVLLVAKL